jgi:hypothetical protein
MVFQDAVFLEVEGIEDAIFALYKQLKTPSYRLRSDGSAILL